MEKTTLSIIVNNGLYQRLQKEIGKGKISDFVSKAVEKQLDEKEKQLERAYREISQDKERWKLTTEWEKVALSDLEKKSK